MVDKWIEKIGQLKFDIKHRASKKIPQEDCLWRVNTEDDEQKAFINAIAIDAEQDNTDYASQGWQLEKLQRIKLLDSQQTDNLLKEVYSWVLKKTTGVTTDVK